MHGLNNNHTIASATKRGGLKKVFKQQQMVNKQRSHNTFRNGRDNNTLPYNAAYRRRRDFKDRLYLKRKVTESWSASTFSSIETEHSPVFVPQLFHSELFAKCLC